jgi:hypothetical protein
MDVPSFPVISEGRAMLICSKEGGEVEMRWMNVSDLDKMYLNKAVGGE